MKYQNIIAYGSIIAGLLGCENRQTQPTGKPEPPKYFTFVPTYEKSGMALAVGDFDGDGDIDFIAEGYSYSEQDDKWGGRLYLFLNDGKGNFTLKEPTKK